MSFIPKGIIPPIITPFHEDGSVNYETLAMMSRHLVKNGVHGLFPMGTTGEFYAVDDEEYRKILVTVKEAVADLKTCCGEPITIYAGCSHITTRGSVRLCRIAEEVGVDAVSVLTPMFISQTQDELYQHFKTIAESTSLPVVMYNNRPKTNVTIEPATAAKLAHEIPNIAAIKDSTGDFTNTEEYLRLTADVRDKFNVLLGRDTLIYAGLCYGASGAIASCANVAPRITADIYDKYIAGDFAGALKAQYTLAPLRIACNMGTFPEVIKEGLMLQNIPVGKCLEPIQELTGPQKETLKKVLEDMNLI